SAKVSHGNAGYEYLNPGICLKANPDQQSTVTMPSDDYGKFTYYRCPPGRQYKVRVIMDVGRKKGQKVSLRLHVYDIQGRRLCICESEQIDLKKGRQNLERLMEVPEIDNSETIYNNPESDNLVNISMEVCFTGMRRDINILSITMEQQNSSQNTIDAGVFIGGQVYKMNGALQKGKIAQITIDGLPSSKSVNEIVASGNRRLTYLVRHSSLEWQVRNATAKYQDHCVEIEKMRNTVSDKMEIIITPLGEYSNPYLHRIRKAEQIKFYPFNEIDRTLTVKIGKVYPGAEMEFVSVQSPRSISGIDNWEYANKLITLELDSPGTMEINY
ncbi:MAG: hypothetical protein K8F30_11970, partial [Taibaiella sp.]|nr:hypothetical protein [Taibaiella sp.]